MIWVCFSLTLCCTHSLTHTCILTHRSLSPSPVCHHNQRSRCFAVTPVLTHLIIPSIYSGCACGSLPDYCVSCIVCVLSLIIELRILTLSCSAWRCWKLLVFLDVLLPPPVSPVPRGLPRLKSLGSFRLQVLFCYFSVLCLRTTDCLVLLIH